MANRPNTPVLVGNVSLFAVTSFVLNEGYKTVSIANSTLTQMVTPTTKTITIDALLIGENRAVRSKLEALALVSRVLASASSQQSKLAGIPVVAKNSVSLDMQITNLVFTQDNQMRDTLRVSMTLTHVPRTSVAALLGGGLDIAVAQGSTFI